MAPIPEFQDLTEKQALQKIQDQEIKFTSGSKYDYNQTNFWLLHRIIEKVSNQSLQQYVIGRQFSNNADDVFFSSDSRDIVMNRVTPYFPFAKGGLTADLSYLQGDYAYAMNGFNISMDKFLEWDGALRSDKLLSANSKSSMLEPFNYTCLLYTSPSPRD